MSAVAQSEVGETEGAEWPIVPLGELCRIELGRTPARAHALNWDEKRSTGNVWLSIADMPTSLHAKAKDSYEYVSDSAAEGMKIVPEGTLLVSFKLTLGRLCYAGRDLFTNEAIAAILDLDESRIMLPFLYWYLTYFDWDAAAAGDHKIKGKTLNKAKLKALRVIVPPLEEQKRIVAVLDQAFAALDRARAHAEANLADAENLLETIKFDVFDRLGAMARRVTLAEVTSIDSTLVDPRKPEFLDMPHLGAGNMVSGSDALVDVMTARQEKLKSGKYLFDDTMILYSKIRPYLRKVARPDFSGVCSADVYPLSPSPELDRDFLFHLLHTKDFTEYAISGSDRAGMPKVNREHLFKYEFGLPSIAAQREAGSKIDHAMGAVDGLRAVLKSKLADLANLRQSLLQKAFSGNLMPD